MKIIVKHAADIAKEDAHGGAGSRKLYIDDKQTDSGRVQGMTHGWLPAGAVFDWHEHDGMEEIMYVLKGTGKVCDADGEYEYGAGTVAVFPANAQHKITNPSTETNEFVFVRIYT